MKGVESSYSPVWEPIAPEPMVEVIVVEAAMDSTSPACVGDYTPVVPDVSREGPFDVHQLPPVLGTTPWVLDNLPGCQYRMTSYDEKDTCSDMDPAYGIHLHDPRLLEYVGAPESARLLSRTPEYWLQHMGRKKTLAAALQLQHDAGLILSNVQVLGQFVSSLNHMASEVRRVAFDRKPFPSVAVQFVTPSHRVRQAAHYMAAMGLWRPTSGPIFPGPLPTSSCNMCMSCSDCFSNLPN